jgi:hypothetical protein
METGNFLAVVRGVTTGGDVWLLPATTIFKMLSERGKKLSLPDSDSPLARAYKHPDTKLSSETEERSRLPPTKQEILKMDSSVGQPFGKLGKDELSEIIGTWKGHWNALRPQIEDIIRRTPSLSENETAPLVLLQGFMAGPEGKHALPTVVVSCNSDTYGTQLEKAIHRSGVLKRYHFQMKREPHPVTEDVVSRAQIV